MGEMPVPNEAYYGASTQRAVLNFPISQLRLPRSFIRALALVKAACAHVNKLSGDVPARTACAIEQAAREVALGLFDEHFVVDVFQTGSGTSTNMNANEVIANRAAELLGGQRGDRSVHPNDHVNKGMSSNDAIPTATHVAAILDMTEQLLPSLLRLALALTLKSREFATVIKTGRTHLQDATPMTLGQEFSGYAAQVMNAIERVKHARHQLSRLALGGTAVGTGVNTRPGFAHACIELLSEAAGIKMTEADNHFQAQSTLDEIVEASGVLRTVAVSLLKIANDVRWLSSGPRAGLGEITLPAVQPGSSIMPGKVNAVIPESLAQVCAQVIGCDATIAVAGQSGNFELNVMQPVAAYNLLLSISLLSSACDNFRRQCVDGIKATDRGPKLVEKGLMLATALVPLCGYDQAAAIAYEAATTGKTVRAIARKRLKIKDSELRRVLNPFRMIVPQGDAVSLQTVLPQEPPVPPASDDAAAKSKSTGAPGKVELAVVTPPSATPAWPDDDEEQDILNACCIWESEGGPARPDADDLLATAPAVATLAAQPELVAASAVTADESMRTEPLIAVTGGIASGKNAVGKKLEELGAYVIDADDLTHELLNTPGAAYQAVLDEFGSDLVDTPGGPINRKKLGKVVFADKTKRERLQAILFPEIRKLRLQRFASVHGKVRVALVPLLFEAGWQDDFDEVWCVWTDRQTQVERLKKRNGLTDDEANARIDAQMSTEERKSRSKRNIDNSGTLAATYQQVETAWAAARADFQKDTAVSARLMPAEGCCPK